jgi:uncharacterized protein YdaU (DUF1376 family)
MPFYVADYLADTGHLSTLEHGAYLLLIMHYWRRGGLPTNDAQLARVCHLSEAEWQEIRATLAALFDAKWKHKRIEAELIKSEARSAAGKAGASARYVNRNATAVRSHSDGNASHSHSHIKIEDANASLSETSSDTLAIETPKRRKRVSYPPDFEAFWTAFPTDALMSKKAAGLVWSRMTEDVRQLAMSSLPAFRAYCSSSPEYRPVHAVRYLTQERYVGFSEVVSKAAGKVFVAKGTPQWTAWQRVRPSSCVTSAEHRQDGWWFEAEWPPPERKTA